MDHNEILAKYHSSAISFVEEGKKISAEKLTRAKDGEWSAAFVIHHIADAEIQFGVRYANALCEDNPTIVPFDEENNTTDIFLLDSMNLGAMFVQHGVEVDEWDDLSVDITKVKLKERYGYYIYEDGLGIGVFRNVAIKANEISLPIILEK